MTYKHQQLVHEIETHICLLVLVHMLKKLHVSSFLGDDQDMQFKTGDYSIEDESYICNNEGNRNEDIGSDTYTKVAQKISSENAQPTFEKRRDTQFSVPLASLLQNQLNFTSEGDTEWNEALEAIQQSLFDDGRTQDDDPNLNLSGHIDNDGDSDEFFESVFETGTLSATSQTNSSTGNEPEHNGTKKANENVSSDEGIKISDIRSKPLYNGSHLTLATTLLIVCLFMI